jgi:hypothetical protein
MSPGLAHAVSAWALIFAGAGILAVGVRRAEAVSPDVSAAAAEARRELETRYPADGARIDRGVDQVARHWRSEDGDAAAFRELVTREFAPSGAPLDGVFERFEFALERMSGYFNSMSRDLRRNVDLDTGPVTSLDRLFAGYEPASHLSDDLFANKIAFVALLNFPLTTLEEREADGPAWSRRRWAEARLASGFSSRVPAEVTAKVSEAYTAAAAYIADYNIYMHHVVAPDGSRPFPPKMRLISHWNLRDELKARYSEPAGLASQRMIAKVMDRIVRQEIPAAVVDNPLLDWNPESNVVTASPVHDADPPQGATAEPRADREPDERYRQWLSIFQAERLRDAYEPENPSLMARRFNVNREIPEAQVEALLESLLSAPVGARVARLVEKRLGRRLEPFDIWYGGFKARGAHTEAELDAVTRKRYPTPAAYAADIPRLLRDLGFSEERSRFLADHIEVDPARGAGHALGATRRDDKAHLRTRVGAGGMDYKGYNIAIHEMGHNVEQVFSCTTIDHTLLQGVPNTAFTEALAFVFQARDLELLGLGQPGVAERDTEVLGHFWQAREIAGVSLVDMEAWRWLYAHTDATPSAFREAVVGIATEVWNRHFAPLLGSRDVALLAIYSHLIDAGLYTPDYPLGHLIEFQVEEHFRSAPGPMGPEFERICQLGSITPDAWMRAAVGAPLSAEPLIAAATRALDTVESAR